tara:strand:- start:1065 stop:1829 length:765 start_codon:yes stop_codon:yes gene_type:complete
MSFYIVIPARYASSRLPAKPLAMIGDKTMIQRVYEQASKSAATKVIVATDDQRIADSVKVFGGEVCMTSDTHTSGTDRLQEVAACYGFSDSDIVVNVQGDEPLIPPQVIDQVAANLAANSAASVATLCEPIASLQDFNDPNVVKVVSDNNGFALYFSRAPIPWPRDTYTPSSSHLPSELVARRHIGIYAYRCALLNRFIRWPPAPLEQLESLEQLRVLSNGEHIHIDLACQKVPGGVDTPADLERIRLHLGALS